MELEPWQIVAQAAQDRLVRAEDNLTTVQDARDEAISLRGVQGAMEFEEKWRKAQAEFNATLAAYKAACRTK